MRREYWIVENTGYTAGTSWFQCGESSYENFDDAKNDAKRMKNKYKKIHAKYRVTHIIEIWESTLV